MAAVGIHLKKKRMRYIERIKAEKEEEYQRGVAMFDQLDVEKTGFLDKERLKKLLKAVYPGEAIDEAMVEYANHLASNRANAQAGFRREDVPAVMRAAKYYLHKSAYVDEIFDQFDSDNTGTLDREQLRSALTHVEHRNAQDRAKKDGSWLASEHAITDEELDHILATSDWDHTSVLTKEEVLFALALWSYIGKKVTEEEACSSKACTLL